MKTIYFVRHGESEANVKKIASGSEFDVAITDKGRMQAKQAGEELKSKNIQLIISSPLSRAIETATIIAETIGYNPKKILTSPYFVERNFGIYSKGPDEEYLKAAISDSLHESVETVEAMHSRITEGLDWLKGLHENTILLVSHGGANRILRLIHQDFPLSHMYKIDRFPNGSIYKFSL